MSMKPIFIITRPLMNDDDGDHFAEMMQNLCGEDYHILILSKDIEDFSFQMFSDHEIEPIELEKLKEVVNKSEQ